MIIEIPNENSIIKWKNDEKDEWKYAEISDLIKAYERPQGEWLFTEIDENYHVYGQCFVCKERNRIGKACRSCGAEMKGGAKE